MQQRKLSIIFSPVHIFNVLFKTLYITEITFNFSNNDNRKSYQHRFQSISANAGNGNPVGGNIVGAGVNDENTNDRNSLDSGRQQINRRGVDRDHRNLENQFKTKDIEYGDVDYNQDLTRKHKKHKRSR